MSAARYENLALLVCYFAADVAASEPDDIEECFEFLTDCYGYGYEQDGPVNAKTGVFNSAIDKAYSDLDPLVAFEIAPELTWYVVRGT